MLPDSTEVDVRQTKLLGQSVNETIVTRHRSGTLTKTLTVDTEKVAVAGGGDLTHMWHCVAHVRVRVVGASWETEVRAVGAGVTQSIAALAAKEGRGGRGSCRKRF